MADRPLPTPLVYASSKQSSPSKIGSRISADPGKLGDPLKHNAPLDRKLAVWDNMNRSMLVDLDVFEDEVLWSQDKGPFPEPTERAKRIATEAVQSLFYPDGSATPANNISEDAIAQMIVSSADCTRRAHEPLTGSIKSSRSEKSSTALVSRTSTRLPSRSP